MSLIQTLEGMFDTARISVPTVLDSVRGPVPATVTEQRLAWWTAKLLRDAKVDLHVSGKEHAGDRREAMIVMSNHQSLYDIPVLLQALPGSLRMVAKAELFRIPVWGRAMIAAGFIRIDRADHEQAVESLRTRGGALLAAGTRVWIAPEGTRSKTGELGPFKSGGFRMALDFGVRILPVVIDGTRHVLPSTDWTVHRGKKVTVTVLPPIDPKPYGIERRKELMADVRRAIAGGLGLPLTA
jgi:1-acyl-sn-glycerol-3-phosphate acyltransferase